MFTKVVNPCKCEINERKYNAFAKIECSDGGRLSICGVVGPKPNGNAAGPCGQCVDSIRSGEVTAEWSAETLSKFCDIWDKYHLNDMRPYCLHQKDAGFADLAKKKVKVFHYLMTRDAYDKKKTAEQAALSALKSGVQFTPTSEQTKYATMPMSFKSYGEEVRNEDYRLDRTDSEMAGWISYDESPEHGILCKPCPVCGYKYGTSWKREEIPYDVLKFLAELPESKIVPAWV